MTLYEILGCQPTATHDELRAAYRKLAQTSHPDKGGDTEQFQAIQQAWDILGDAEKRKRYDETGSIPGQGPSIREQALGFLAQGIGLLLKRPPANMLQALREQMADAKKGLVGQKVDLERQIAKLQKLLQQTTAKPGKQNSLALIYLTMLAGLEAQKAQLEAGIEVMQEALRILAEHEFQVDPEDQPASRREREQSLEDLFRQAIGGGRTFRSDSYFKTES